MRQIKEFAPDLRVKPLLEIREVAKFQGKAALISIENTFLYVYAYITRLFQNTDAASSFHQKVSSVRDEIMVAVCLNYCTYCFSWMLSTPP